MGDNKYSSVVSVEELDFTRGWAAALAKLEGSEKWKERLNAGLPFTFKYGDRCSCEFINDLQWDVASEDWADGKREHVLCAIEPETKLKVSVELTEYSDFPAIEWLIHFTNEGNADSPAISDVSALDISWKQPGVIPVLHRSRGSDERPDDFEYMSEEMRVLRSTTRTVHMDSGAGAAHAPTKESKDGRSSVDWMPFFNLQSADNGIFLAIGWTGQWAVDFIHDGEGNTHIKGGMEYTNLRLHPGESIRTPRILAMYWQGELTHSHNMFRKFILTHHTPQENGKPANSPFSCGSWGGWNTDEHMKLIKKITDNKLPYDYYWIDAGWYGTGTEPCPDVFNGDWGITGDWQINKLRHPDGLKPIRDEALKSGMKFLLWIEPLRATYKTPVTLEHPDWFLSFTGKPAVENESLLLNLGNPEACQWAIETVSSLISEIGIDCYREDYNFFGALECFHRVDEPGRLGITEIRFFEGLYKFWDELLRRHPGLLIDNCASGGRRIDLETISRSIALWRTDYTCFQNITHKAIQLHSVGLAYWVPLNGTSPAAKPNDTYAFRSALSSAMSFAIDEFGLARVSNDSNYPWDWHRRMMNEFLRVRPYWYGDYYPFMECTLSSDTWIAYQLHRPDLEEGAVVAFRRENSPLKTAVFELRGLTEDTVYEFEDADSGKKWQLTTDELEIVIPEKRSSRLIFYKKVK